MAEQHTILGGKVHVYKRPNRSLWQCSSYFAGKNRRTSTKEESLSKAKRSPRTGICNYEENSAAEKSKRKKPSAKHRNYSFVNTTSSHRASAAKSTWKANSGARRGTWCRSSVSWACRKLLPARSRTTAFIATKKRWRTAASRRPATPCIRRWSLFDKP